MSQFDIAYFEERLDALLAAHAAVLADYRALQHHYEHEQHRNRETRERLNGVIERIRALEAEAQA